MEARLKWAQEHLHWTLEQWYEILWTDKSAMQVTGKTWIWVTQKPGEEYHMDCVISKFKKFSSCMIWGSISGNYGTGKLFDELIASTNVFRSNDVLGS